MPRVKIGGVEMQIPFNPITIGDLIYRGYKVMPDRDISPEQHQFEQTLINNELSRLWGDQKLKSNFKSEPFSNPFPKTEGMTGPPSGIPPSNWSGRIFKEGETIIPPKVNHDYLDVQPNPGVDYQMRQMFPSQTPERQTTMNSKEPVTGLLWYLLNKNETETA